MATVIVVISVNSERKETLVGQRPSGIVIFMPAGVVLNIMCMTMMTEFFYSFVAVVFAKAPWFSWQAFIPKEP